MRVHTHTHSHTHASNSFLNPEMCSTAPKPYTMKAATNDSDSLDPAVGGVAAALANRLRVALQSFRIWGFPIGP